MAIRKLRNLLLDAMPSKAREFLDERMAIRPLAAGEPLCRVGEPLTHVVFPHDAVVSLQSAAGEKRAIENASVGHEGLVGVNALLGERVMVASAIVAIAGQASWLQITDLEIALDAFDPVREILFGYSAWVIRQLMHRLVCGSVHSAQQRIATWLLYAHRRTEGDSFELTQRQIATMFGLRLATVSDACARLANAGAIHYSRGYLTIDNTSALRAQACACYEMKPKLTRDGEAAGGPGPTPRPASQSRTKLAMERSAR